MGFAIVLGSVFKDFMQGQISQIDNTRSKEVKLRVLDLCLFGIHSRMFPRKSEERQYH